MASEDDTVLQNMLGTFKEYCSRLRVCSLSTDAHPYEVFYDLSVKAVWCIVCQILFINPFQRAKYTCMLGTFLPRAHAQGVKQSVLSSSWTQKLPNLEI